MVLRVYSKNVWQPVLYKRKSELIPVATNDIQYRPTFTLAFTKTLELDFHVLYLFSKRIFKYIDLVKILLYFFPKSFD